MRQSLLCHLRYDDKLISLANFNLSDLHVSLKNTSLCPFASFLLPSSLAFDTHAAPATLQVPMIAVLLPVWRCYQPNVTTESRDSRARQRQIQEQCAAKVP